MLQIEHTENNLGIEITGSFNDFDTLYDSISALTISEESYPGFLAASNPVYALLYDLRHAAQGDREIYIDTINVDTLENRSIEYDGDAIFSFKIPWNLAVFVVCALEAYKNLSMNDRAYRMAHVNEYMRDEEHTKKLYQEHKKKRKYNHAVVTIFQEQVWELLEDMISITKYRRWKKIYEDSDVIKQRVSTYLTQYIDYADSILMKLSPFERRRYLSKSLSYLLEELQLDDDNEYIQLYITTLKYSKEDDIHISEVQYNHSYPEEIIW